MATHNYPIPAAINKYQRTGMMLGGLGLILLVVGLFVSGATQFFHSYLLGYILFLGLSAGSLGLLMLQYLTGGAWGVVGRRIFEAGSRLMPIAALLFIPILLGMHDIFSWTHDDVQKEAIVHAKGGYLNTPFFIIRAVVYFLFWTGMATVLNRFSRLQDERGDAGYSWKLEKASGPGLLFFVLLMTFASVDWLMSLTPEWYSTIYGFIIIVSQAISAMTFAVIILTLLSRTEPMASLLKPVHLHDFGKLLFAFNFLWGYLNFSQFLITYSGNLPEEIIWYHHRIRGGWQIVAYMVIFMHFILPFILLLSRDLKRNSRTLLIVACWLLAMRAVDLYWLIEPNWHRGDFFLSWMDVAAPIGFFGLYLYLFVWQYKKRTLLPVNEPELEIALHPKAAH